MTIYQNGDHRTHDMHGARFDSYVAPFRGSRELCAWRTQVRPGAQGAAHTVSHEEVFLVLEGTPTVVLDGEPHPLRVGDVAHVPALASVRLDNPGDAPAALWVTTSVGLTATSGGQAIAPPWTL